MKLLNSICMFAGSVSSAGKKCLVLDIDYTLFDLNSSAEHPDELARPYLHEFLTACYEYYDIIIWSATNMKWVEVRAAGKVHGHMQHGAVLLTHGVHVFMCVT